MAFKLESSSPSSGMARLDKWRRELAVEVTEARESEELKRFIFPVVVVVVVEDVGLASDRVRRLEARGRWGLGGFSMLGRGRSSRFSSASSDSAEALRRRVEAPVV